MDFEADIRLHVLTHLPHDGKHATELSSKSTNDLLLLYVNWLDRLIDARPRRVHRSSLLDNNPAIQRGANARGLKELCDKFEAGENVNPHLSRGVISGFMPRGVQNSLWRRRDLDLLLFSWGIHHLHLGTKLDRDGFVERTSYLLFAIIRPDDVYLVDIAAHGSWGEQRMLEVLARDWPTSGLLDEVHGVTGETLTDSQRQTLRDKGTNAIFAIGGKAYLPAGRLITAAGTSLSNNVRADRLWLDAMAYQQILTDYPDTLKTHFISTSFSYPNDPDWHFAFFAEGYGVEERRTGFKCRIKLQPESTKAPLSGNPLSLD